MASDRHRWDPVCVAPRLVRPVRIDPAGRTGPTRGQARGSGWRQTTFGFYVPAWVDARVPEQRILEQSMRLPEGGAVTGWAACRMHGAAFFDGLARDGSTPLPVPLAVGPLGHLRKLAGSTVTRDRLLECEILERHGVRCTRPGRALFDAMRTATDVREATVHMDMMAAARLVSVCQMERYVATHPGWQGVEQVRAALRLASEDSRSPNETRMRLVWVLDAALPRPLVNRPVFDLSGRLLGYPDLFDPVAGVVGEYDGAEHRRAHRHSRDVAREDHFRRAGLEYFTVTGPDLADPLMVVDRMLATRARAKWAAGADRRWTLEPPPDWEPERSLDELFAYREMIHGLPAGTTYRETFGDLPPSACPGGCSCAIVRHQKHRILRK
jgi:hypothetical protein